MNTREVACGTWTRNLVPATTEFGQVLRDLRLERGISMTALGAAAGRPGHSTIARLEAGSRMPSRNTVLRLAIALDLNERDEARLLRAANFHTPIDGTRDALVEDFARLMADPRMVGAYRQQVRDRMARYIEHARRQMGGGS